MELASSQQRAIDLDSIHDSRCRIDIICIHMYIHLHPYIFVYLHCISYDSRWRIDVIFIRIYWVDYGSIWQRADFWKCLACTHSHTHTHTHTHTHIHSHIYLTASQQSCLAFLFFNSEVTQFCTDESRTHTHTHTHTPSPSPSPSHTHTHLTVSQQSCLADTHTHSLSLTHTHTRRHRSKLFGVFLFKFWNDPILHRRVKVFASQMRVATCKYKFSKVSSLEWFHTE